MKEGSMGCYTFFIGIYSLSAYKKLNGLGLHNSETSVVKEHILIHGIFPKKEERC